jgi:hypothetical protein
MNPMNPTAWSSKRSDWNVQQICDWFSDATPDADSDSGIAPEHIAVFDHKLGRLYVRFHKTVAFLDPYGEVAMYTNGTEHYPVEVQEEIAREHREYYERKTQTLNVDLIPNIAVYLTHEQYPSGGTEDELWSTIAKPANLEPHTSICRHDYNQIINAMRKRPLSPCVISADEQTIRIRTRRLNNNNKSS